MKEFKKILIESIDSYSSLLKHELKKCCIDKLLVTHLVECIYHDVIYLNRYSDD